MDLLSYLDYLQFSWEIILLLFVRIYAALTGCILFQRGSLPNLVRACISLMLAIIIYSGGLFNHLALPESSYGLILLVMKEAVYGYLMGIGLSLPFLLVESCGKIIDQQRGEQFAAIMNPLTHNTAASSSKLIFQSFVAYFVVSGGILAYLDLIINSLFVIHLNQFFPANPITHGQLYSKLFASYCYWSVVLAMPLIITGIMIDVVLGLISSFIPQLNVTTLSIPIKSLVLLGILTLTIENIFKFPWTLIHSLAQIIANS